MNFAPAILYAVSSSTLLAVALAFLRGGLNSGSVAIAVSFGLMVAAFAFWQVYLDSDTRNNYNMSVSIHN